MVSSPDPQPASAADALERLGRLSLRELAAEGLLQTVADLARTVVPGELEVSVSLLAKGRPTTVVSTGRLAVDLDGEQYEGGHGPCLHAARTGELVEVTDSRTDDRWPGYLPRAAERGALSSLSVPLSIDVDEQVSGALNLYARTSGAFDADARTAAARFGPYAAVAAGNLHAHRSARDMADDLQAALESRAAVDRAKSVLVRRYRLSPDQAFHLLAQASMSAERTVRDIADDLVRTGRLPAVAAREGSGRPRPPRGPGRRGPQVPPSS